VDAVEEPVLFGRRLGHVHGTLHQRGLPDHGLAFEGLQRSRPLVRDDGPALPLVTAEPDAFALERARARPAVPGDHVGASAGIQDRDHAKPRFVRWTGPADGSRRRNAAARMSTSTASGTKQSWQAAGVAAKTTSTAPSGPSSPTVRSKPSALNPGRSDS